jgi:hypothetical protein
MLIHMNRFTNIKTDDFKPLASTLTVEQAAAKLATMSDLPLYVEVWFDTYPDAPVSIAKQVAAKVRRIKKLAALCGRHMVRVDRDTQITVRYRALLAR